MKMGTSQFAPFPWTNENLFDMRKSAFKMSDGKKQKSTNYPRMFAAQPAEKKCQDSLALETDAGLPAVTVRLCSTRLCT